jgi:iron uptake system component EfeO
VLAAGVGLAACGSGGSASNSAKGSNTLKVTLTDKGCEPAKASVAAGALTVAVDNGGTSAVTEMELKDNGGIILGESENVVAGLSGKFSLNVKPGTYVMNCPNGDSEDNGRLTVTGTAPAQSGGPDAALLAKATGGYRSYVAREGQVLLAGTKSFAAAVEAGDIARAKSLFGPVRRHYEAIEPVAESFGDLDPEIDARVNDVASEAEWTGFHRIEQILWVKDATTGAKPFARKLVADVETLVSKVGTLSFQAPQLANGAVELLNEVANSKITGEEDRYSHTDLSDFAGNLAGAREAFELLKPALGARGEGAVAATIQKRFEVVEKGLDAYKRGTPLGYALYSELTPTDRRRFAQEVDALAEPLSTVAARVTG